MRRALICLPLLLVAGCTSSPSDIDTLICAQQVTDLGDARDTLVVLQAYDPEPTFPTVVYAQAVEDELKAGSAALDGYAAEDERLADAVTAANVSLERLLVDLETWNADADLQAAARVGLAAVDEACQTLG